MWMFISNEPMVYRPPNNFAQKGIHLLAVKEGNN